jgi:hypothetical protein
MSARDDREFDAMAARFRADAVAKIADSAFTMSLVPGGTDLDSFDVKFALELGASIMLNKPIVALAVDGREVPPGLERIAHAVIRLDGDLDTKAGQLEAQAKIADVMKSLGLEMGGRG